MVATLAAGLVALAACTPVKGAPSPAPRVVVWGDSFGEAVTPLLPSSYEVRAFGGTAPCDWVDDIRATAARRAPAVAVLLFVGNTFTPCTGGTTVGYAADTARAVAYLHAVGTEVVIVAAPPFRAGPSPNPVNAAYLAAGADVIWGPSESVAPGGIYRQEYREADGAHLNGAGARRFADAIRRELG